MNAYDIKEKIEKYFNGNAQVYVISKNRIEVDVSKEVDKSEWQKCAESIGLIDNSKSISSSWKRDGVTVVFFFGPLQKFLQKNNVNYNVFNSGFGGK